MSEEYKDDVTSEDNTAQENTPEVSHEQDSSDAEGKKIAAILERKNKKIAELEAQLTRGSSTVEAPVASTNTGLSREEAILFAKGLSEQEVDQASKIAKIEGISLTEALNDDMFVAWKEAQERKAKSAKAQLGASNGSPQSPEKKSFDSKGLEREDHKALFDKRLGR